MKKQNNPFKMKGAWIGGFLGLGYFLISLLTLGTIPHPLIYMAERGLIPTLSLSLNYIIFNFFLGFLAGWGIQSLWGKSRK